MSAFPDLALERGMPASPDAERSVLGAILLENGHFHEADEKLHKTDFSLGSHAVIYARIADLVNSGRATNLVTLVEELSKRKEIESVGGVAYISSLTERLPYRLSIREYVDIVLEKAKLRRVIRVSDTAMTRAFDQSDPAEDIIAAADRELLDIQASMTAEDVTLEQQSDSTLARIEDYRKGKRVPAIPSGIRPLDMFTGGYPIGQLTCIGGRPSRGKSSSLAQAAIENCPAGRFVHLTSIEMTAEELLERIWAAVAEVPFWKTQEPQALSDADMQSLRYARNLVAAWPLKIDASSVITPDQLLARLKIIKRKHNTGLAMVDYLQRITFPGKKDEWAELGNVAMRLAEFAKAEQVPVVVLSSLTDKGKDENTPPSMGDLRQSGDIQYHTNNIYLIHRTRDAETQEINPETMFIVAKKRQGKTGNVKARFNSTTLLFDALEGRDQR